MTNGGTRGQQWALDNVLPELKVPPWPANKRKASPDTWLNRLDEHKVLAHLPSPICLVQWRLHYHLVHWRIYQLVDQYRLLSNPLRLKTHWHYVIVSHIIVYNSYRDSPCYLTKSKEQ